MSPECLQDNEEEGYMVQPDFHRGLPRCLFLSDLFLDLLLSKAFFLLGARVPPSPNLEHHWGYIRGTSHPWVKARPKSWKGGLQLQQWAMVYLEQLVCPKAHGLFLCVARVGDTPSPLSSNLLFLPISKILSGAHSFSWSFAIIQEHLARSQHTQP